MGIIFAVSTALLLGVSNFLLKRSFKDFPPSIAFFILGIFSIIFWVPVGLILRVDFNQWLLGSTVGIISAILGQALYIYVLEKGELSITVTLLDSFSIYTIILSMIFLQERPQPLALFFIFLTILGTIIVSLPDRFEKKELRKKRVIIWAVIAAMCVGVSDTFAKFYIDKTSVGSFLFFVSFAQLIVSFLYLKLEKQSLNQLHIIVLKYKEYKYAILGSLLIAIATMFLFLSFNFTLASIASPIAASAPVITIILAITFLKEKISLKNGVGIFLVLISIIVVGFLTS